MKRWMIVLSASTLALALASCASRAAVPPEASPSISGRPADVSEALPSPSEQKEATGSDETETASANPAPAEVPKRYKMNKNYDIVPIDPQKTERKVVLLTFDDGPKSADTLDPILDSLDKHKAKAIFFVNGFRVQENPELLKEIDKRGHAIGNHSWDHIKLGKEKPEVVRKQIGRVQEAVQNLTGKAPVFFRPPHASGSDVTRAVAKEYGLLYMTWSNGSLDWEMTGDDIKDKPQAIIDNVMSQLHAGSNILMHELPWTAEGLDRLLTELEKKGYGFVDPAAIALDDEGN